MKKIIKLTESDLEKIIQKVLNEQNFAGTSTPEDMGYLKNINPNNLKKGDRDKPGDVNGPVSKLQQKLMKIGFLKTKSMKPTGYFGDLTDMALSKYLSKPNTTPKVAPKEKIQKSKYNLTPRIDKELEFIKQRGMDNKPFFIYDPLQNLIYLFNTGGNLVDYSQVVDGADTQKNKPTMTIEMWCKLSGLDTSPYKCTDKATKQKKDPYYSVLSNTADRFITKGIYKISYLARHEGYQGSGKNQFGMVDDKGKPIAAAIHGIPGLPARLKASQELEGLLKKDLSSGKVPKEYLDSIKTIANANQSFGCIGVPAKFIDNPKVQELAKGANVFVMGDDNNFLVQNAEQYFNKLSGNGESCVNPESLASRMSTMA